MEKQIYASDFLWDLITHPSPYFTAVGVKEWMANYTQLFM